MIFSPDLAAKVTLGKKTVTRRPVKRELDSGALLPCRYQPGHTYAVQLCRGGVEVDRIRVLSVRRETIVFPISEDEAKAEGFDSAAGFARRWNELYSDDAPCDVWRIEFEAFPERSYEEAGVAW